MNNLRISYNNTDKNSFNIYPYDTVKSLQMVCGKICFPEIFTHAPFAGPVNLQSSMPVEVQI